MYACFSLSLSVSSMFLSAIATNLSFPQLGLVGWPQAAYKPQHTPRLAF